MGLLDTLQQQAQAVDNGSNFKSQSDTSGGLIKAASVPVEVPWDGGTLRIYLEIPVECLSDPQTLNAVLSEIERTFNIAVYRRKSGGGVGFKQGGYGENNYRNDRYSNNRYNNRRY